MTALETAIQDTDAPKFTVIEGSAPRRRHRRGDGTVYEDKRNHRFVVKGPWDGGKKHYYRTKTEAENARRAMAGQLLPQKDGITDPNITVAGWVKNHWEPTRQTVTAGTRKHDRPKVELFMRHFGRRRLRDLTSKMIFDYVNTTLVTVGKDNPTERKHHHRVIHKVLQAAADAKVAIAINPAARIKVNGYDHRLVLKAKILSKKQWTALRRGAETLDGTRRTAAARSGARWLPYRFVFDLLLYLHLRPGEIFGLTWDRIDLDTSTVHIAQQLQPNGGTPSPKGRAFFRFADTTQFIGSSLEIVPLKRSTGIRTLEIDERSHQAILEMLAAQKAIRRRDPNWNPANLVVPDLDGCGFHDKDFHRHFWEPVAELAGLKLRRKDSAQGFYLYCLKHSGMTRRIANGTGLNTVKRLSGHTSDSTVFKYIGLVPDEEFNAAVRKSSRDLP